MKLITVDTLLPGGQTILCENIVQAKYMAPLADRLSKQLNSCGTGIEAEQNLLALKNQIIQECLPTEIASPYIAEIDLRLKVIDQGLRTALGKLYRTREEAAQAQYTYDKIREDMKTDNPQENGAAFRQRIIEGHFLDTVEKELLDELYQYENATEIKVAKKLSSISGFILLAIIVGGYIFDISGTWEYANKSIVLFGRQLLPTNVDIVEKLTLFDGLKNGIIVFGRSFGNIFVNGFFEYIAGFATKGIIGDIIWAVLGLFLVLFKGILWFIPQFFVSLVITLVQKASIGYYVGYILGSAAPWLLSQFSFDSENPQESVEKIKRRKWKKR